MPTRIPLAVIAMLFAACAPRVSGVAFESESDLLEALGTTAVVGRFDLQWPATVVRVESATGEELRFAHAGTEHCYPGVEVARVRLVHIRRDQHDGLLVVLDGAP